MDTAPLWFTPFLLLPGVALLVMSTAARYSALHDEILETCSGADFAHYFDADRLRRRARHFRSALTSLYVSAALLPLASLAGLVSPATLAVLMVAAVLATLYATARLIVESTLSLRVIEAHLRQRTESVKSG